MIVYFLVQSTYDIKLINKSIDKFIIFLKNDIKNNKNTYIEKFSSLKKSKILMFEKPFINLDEEVNTYTSSILEKYGIFNINQVLKNICKKIKFKDFIQAVNKIINSKENYRIIFNKNI
jgi:secreted Zn-dependent insulinase-like peptidase